MAWAKAPLRLTVGCLETLEETFAREQEVRFSDPLQEVRILFRLGQLPFPRAGRYQFTLLADGELVANQVLRVLAREEQS
jgi:hypothetical protein